MLLSGHPKSWRQQNGESILDSSPSTDERGEVDEESGDFRQTIRSDHDYPIDSTYSGGGWDLLRTYPSTLPPDLVDRGFMYRISVMTPRMIPSSRVNNPYLQSWLPLSLDNQILFPALLFASLTHKRARWHLSGQTSDPFEAQDERLLALCYKDTINLANEALRDPARAVSDTTILSILMTIESATVPADRDWNRESPFKAPLKGLQWLNIHGARVPNLGHQNGLSKLIKLKGGLQNIETPGVASSIFYRTLVNATITLSRPQFPFFSVYGNVNPSLREYFDSGLGDYDYGVHKLSGFGLPTELAEVLQALKDYSSIIAQYINGDVARPDTRIICDQRNLVHFHVMSLPSTDELDASETSPIYEACRIAAIIYSVGVVFPLPGVGTPLPRLAALLKEELQKSSLSENGAWSDDPSLLIWVLAMGAIAATNMPERESFVDILSQHTEQIHITEWHEFKRKLSNICWVDSACDDAGEKLWNEVEQSRRESQQTEPYETPESIIPKPISKRPQPCAHCGRRRVRCDKQNPCQNCVKHGLKCTYERISNLLQQQPIQLISRKRPCWSCKRRKIKCEGQNPCNNCHRGGFDCFYEIPRGQ